MLAEEYGEFILNMREAAGLTTEELAGRLEVSVTSLKGFERGEKKPPEPDKFMYQLRQVVKEKIRARRR